MTVAQVFDPDLDFNGDFENSILDVDALTMVGDLELGVGVSQQNQQFDLNDDNIIDVRDLDEFLERAAFYVGSGRPLLHGDANFDGFVDGEDFIIWNQNKFALQDRWSRGDFSGNGSVDGVDFIYWNQNKSIGVVAVPEPALSIGSLLILILTLRRPSSRFVD